MFFYRVFMTLVVFLCVPLSASAHRLHESYVYFNVAETSLSGRFEATLEDIDAAIGIDDNGDGVLTEAELANNIDRAYALFSERLELLYRGQNLPISYARTTVLGTAQGEFAQIWFDVGGLTSTPNAIDVSYRPLADLLGSDHYGFALIESNTRVGLENNESYISLFFRPNDPPQTLSLAGEPLGKLFVDFGRHGAWHIWLGFDHLLFLGALLLPAALSSRSGRWEPKEALGPVLSTYVQLVVIFTIGHAITLSLATSGFVQLPSTLITAAIAASIIAIALLNLVPHMRGRLPLLVFIFGLVHGLGIAQVLAALGLSPTNLAVGLLAFSLGLAIGQIAIVVIALPLIWLFRRWSLYVPLGVRVGSVAMIALAGVWLLERTTAFEWDMRGTLAFVTGLVS